MIVDLRYPEADFASARAFRECRKDVEAYAAAIRRFVDTLPVDREDTIAILWDELGELGYDHHEIQWHVDNPGKRMRQGFA